MNVRCFHPETPNSCKCTTKVDQGRAGLLQPNSSVALLAHQRAVAACEGASEREMRPRANQRNRGQVTLSSASQLRSAEAAVRELSARLGYDLLEG